MPHLPLAAFAPAGFLLGLGLVTFRLLWSAPFIARLGVLPNSWRGWIFDTSKAKKIGSNSVTVALALVAGFLGGALSYYVRPVQVGAQEQTSAPPEIRAHKFVLVDENGMPRGVFGFRSDGSPDIQISYAKGQSYASGLVSSARWFGVFREKNLLVDLKPNHSHQGRPSGSD